MIRGVLALVFVIFFIPFAGVLGLTVTFLTGRVNFLYALAMGGVNTALWLGGIRRELVGYDKIDFSRPQIFMFNHVSNVDPPVVVPPIKPRTSVLVKKELFRIPLLGRAMRIARLVPVDRSNREAAIESMQYAEEVLRGGLHMVVFPEGTRSRDGRLLPFKKGPFYIALNTGTPIVPVTVLGTRDMMPKGSVILRGGTATLVFHPPVDPAAYPDREALMAAVRSAIASALPPDMQAVPE